MARRVFTLLLCVWAISIAAREPEDSPRVRESRKATALNQLTAKEKEAFHTMAQGGLSKEDIRDHIAAEKDSIDVDPLMEALFPEPRNKEPGRKDGVLRKNKKMLKKAAARASKASKKGRKPKKKTHEKNPQNKKRSYKRSQDFNADRAKQLKQKKARDARAEKGKSNLPEPGKPSRSDESPKFKRDPKKVKRIKPERIYESPNSDGSERERTPDRSQEDRSRFSPRREDAAFILEGLPGFIQTETEIEI